MITADPPLPEEDPTSIEATFILTPQKSTGSTCRRYTGDSVSTMAPDSPSSLSTTYCVDSEETHFLKQNSLVREGPRACEGGA